MKGFTKFDASEFLDSDDVIAEYLAAALEDDNPDVFVVSLSNVASARGKSQVAAAAGLSLENLTEVLNSGSALTYGTVRKLLNVFGLKLTVEKAVQSQSADFA